MTDSDGITLATYDLDVDLDSRKEHALLGRLPGELRYGRAFFAPVYSPEVARGAETGLPFVLEYWNGSEFVTHTSDNNSFYNHWSLKCSDGSLECSILSAMNQASDPAQLHNGRSDRSNLIWLGRPGVGHTGDLNISIDVDDWLTFDWSGTGDEDPATAVTFGRYRGSDRIVYWRELH